MWQREELLQPIDAIGGPAMDGRRAVTPAQNATHRDDDDVHEQMFTIARMSWVGKRFKIGADRFNIYPLRCHEEEPSLCESHGPAARPSIALSREHRHSQGVAGLCRSR